MMDVPLERDCRCGNALNGDGTCSRCGRFPENCDCSSTIEYVEVDPEELAKNAGAY